VIEILSCGCISSCLFIFSFNYSLTVVVYLVFNCRYHHSIKSISKVHRYGRPAVLLDRKLDGVVKLKARYDRKFREHAGLVS